MTGLVNTLSEHPVVQHEPFNEERVFGHVSKAWRENNDHDRLISNIEAALAPRPLIKHCYELVAPEVNKALMEISTRMGYRHVVLDRRAEVDRILSLELAKITGVWGKVGSFKIYEEVEAGTRSLGPIDIAEAVAHLRFCQQRRADVHAQLKALDEPYFEVFFEDVYSDFESGRVKVRKLLKYLEIDTKTYRGYAQKLTDALKRQGQNSARVIDLVPNVAQARTELSAALATFNENSAP